MYLLWIISLWFLWHSNGVCGVSIQLLIQGKDEITLVSVDR